MPKIRHVTSSGRPRLRADLPDTSRVDPLTQAERDRLQPLTVAALAATRARRHHQEKKP